MNRLLSFFFGCFHERTTFPITIKKRTYVCCLDCGKELPYNWEAMRLGEPGSSQPMVAEEMGR